MNRIFNPMLFLLANVPEVEKSLEILMSMLNTTTESVKNIKSGIDNFQATILQMSQTMPGASPPKPPPFWTKPPATASGPATAKNPSPGPVNGAEPTPTIQVPPVDPPSRTL